MEKKTCLSLLVENNFGVLSRISGLFARRGYNIDSLTVGTTENAKFSRITITVTGDEQILTQIKKQLNKLIDVITVIELKPEESITRELVFIKVKADDTNGESPKRYYSTPVVVRGVRYFVCSEWFEVAANNDRPYLLKWLTLRAYTSSS